MRPTAVIPMTLLLASLVSPSPSGAADHGELSLLGTGLDSGAQWLTLRYVAGDDLQFRAGVSMLRVETASTWTAGRRWQGPHRVETADGWTTGPGDLYLAVSKRMAGGSARLFRLDTSLDLKVPTADEDRNLGTGEWDYRLGVAGEYRFWSATLYGGAGWNRLGDPAWTDFNDVFDVLAGVDGEPVLDGRLILGGWVEAWQETVDGAGHPVSIGVGLRTTGSTRWRFQVEAGLVDPAPDLKATLGVSFGLDPPGPGVRGPQR